MRVTHIVVRFAITGNLGNFNSVQSSLEYGIEFKEGEDIASVVEHFQAVAKTEVYEEIASVKGKKPKKHISYDQPEEDLL